MAVKSADQLTIVDITDAYSVILTNEAYTFPGTTDAAVPGSTTTQIIALRGAEQIAASVDLTAITKPSGVTVTKDANVTSPTLTITVASTVTTGGVVEIPISVGGGVTITKDFTFSIAYRGGNGLNGNPGADAITMSITSSAGTIFKNSAITTTLTAHVYKAGVEVTGSALTALGTIKWYKDGGATAVSTGPSLDISAGDVTNKATYVAQLEG